MAQQANCAIEATIDECLRTATAVAAAARRKAARRSSRASQGGGANGLVSGGSGGAGAYGAAAGEGGGMKRGLPSWIHMPSLGLPSPGVTPSASRVGWDADTRESLCSATCACPCMIDGAVGWPPPDCARA